MYALAAHFSHNIKISKFSTPESQKTTAFSKTLKLPLVLRFAVKQESTDVLPGDLKEESTGDERNSEDVKFHRENRWNCEEVLRRSSAGERRTRED